MKIPFPSTGIITYNNQELKVEARRISEARTAVNTETGVNNSNSKGFRGDKESTVSFLGVKAELIVRNFIKERNIQSEFSELLAKYPDKKPDVIIGDLRPDVKGMWGDDKECKVNKGAHFKKNVTHYWFVKIFDGADTIKGRAEYWIIDAVYVSLWNLVDGIYGDPYFSEQLENVKKLVENEK